MQQRHQIRTSTTKINITLTSDSMIEDSVIAKAALIPLNYMLRAANCRELHANDIINATLSGSGLAVKSETKTLAKITTVKFHLDQPDPNNSPLCFTKYIDGNLTLSKINKEKHEGVLNGNFNMGGIFTSSINNMKIPYHQTKDEQNHKKTISSTFKISSYGINTLFKFQVEKPMKVYSIDEASTCLLTLS